MLVRIRGERQTNKVEHIIEERLPCIETILDCWLVTGGGDYLLRVVTASLEAYEDFVRRKLHATPGIASIDSSFAYGVIKQQRAFPLTVKPR